MCCTQIVTQIWVLFLFKYAVNNGFVIKYSSLTIYLLFKKCKLYYCEFHFRIANIKDGATQLVIQIDSPWENERYAVYSVDDFFDKPVLLTNSSRELVKWLNGELDERI